MFALHRVGDPSHLGELWPHLEVLSHLDPGGNTLTSEDLASVSQQPQGPFSSATNSHNSSFTDVAGSEAPITITNVSCGQELTITSSIGEDDGLSSHPEGEDELTVSWKLCARSVFAVLRVLTGLVHFLQHYSHRRLPDHHHHFHHNSHHHHNNHHHHSAGVGSTTKFNSLTNPSSMKPPTARPPLSQPPPRQSVTSTHQQPYDEDFSNRVKPNRNYPNNSFGPINDNNANVHSLQPHQSTTSVKSEEKTLPSNDYIRNSQTNSKQVYNSPSKPNLQSHSDYRNGLIASSTHGDCDIYLESNEDRSKIELTPTKVYDTPKVVEMCQRSQQLRPYLSVPPTPPSLVCLPTGPTQSYIHQTFSTGPPSFSPYNQQAAMYGQMPPHPSSGPPSAVYPQAPTPLLSAELYPSSAGTSVLVNHVAPPHHHVYNMITTPTAIEFPPPPSAMGGQLLQALPAQPMTGMTQQLVQPILGSWYEFQPAMVSPAMQHPSPRVISPQPNALTVSPPLMHHEQSHVPIIESLPPTKVAKKSLSELQERKKAIMTRLFTIVGREETEEVEEHIANNQEHLPCVIPRTSSETSKYTPEFTSTYSIWTSGANFYSIARSCIEKDKNNSSDYLPNNQVINTRRDINSSGENGDESITMFSNYY